ncbi:MAG: hypothetical protein H0V35_07130 [Nitrospira sp.]|nr:hypothetical protein [Nitrospira sp.]
MQIGDTIRWELTDFGHQEGVVDFLHGDADGSHWAFVTLPDGQWAAVNMTHATVVEG